jgi:hypothetical protein
MVHHWRWHGSTRVQRLTRPKTVIGLLLACMLLAALPATASASTPDVRGEWSVTITSSKGPFSGVALITEGANPEGKFAAHSMIFEGQIKGTFEGTLEGATATVETTSEAAGSFLPAGKFKSETITVESGASSLALKGSGTLVLGTEETTATFNATRVKTQQQIEEQEARERKEREEKEARANVRGEWALTVQSGPEVLKGTALIIEEANAENRFAAASTLFEGFIPGTFSGKLEGAKATVTVTTEPTGSFPEGKFTSAAIVVTSAGNPSSMTGTGELTLGGPPSPATLTATRIKTHQEVLEREAAELEAREKQEREAREAQEKTEREAREKAEREAQEKRTREAREALEKITKVTPLPLPQPSPTALLPVLLSTKTLTVGHGGGLSLALKSPNGSAVHGHLKVTLAKAGKGASAKPPAKSSTLGEASFSISADGTEIVKVKLSQSGRAELAHPKTLHVLVAVTTQASGLASASKTYSLTLHVSGSTHRKG